MFTFPDVTDWKNDIFADYSGYTRKTGKISPDGTRYMVKFEKRHTFKSTPMNLIEQHINSEIIRILGYPAQETFLATCYDYLVLCCKNFIPESSKLVTMDVFLRTLYNSYELTEITDLEKFERVLDTNTLLQPHKDSLTQSFWDMVVLDVFLMNLERTTADYGYLVSEQNVVQAPLFDNRTSHRAISVPLVSDKKLVLHDNLLYTDKFKEFHKSVARILPVIEQKFDTIHDFIYSSEYLSDSQKKMKYENLCETLRNLQISYKLRQVASTMSIENMDLTEQSYNNLQEIATGRKTVDEIVAEIIKRYT